MTCARARSRVIIDCIMTNADFTVLSRGKAITTALTYLFFDKQYGGQNSPRVTFKGHFTYVYLTLILALRPTSVSENATKEEGSSKSREEVCRVNIGLMGLHHIGLKGPDIGYITYIRYIRNLSIAQQKYVICPFVMDMSRGPIWKKFRCMIFRMYFASLSAGVRDCRAGAASTLHRPNQRNFMCEKSHKKNFSIGP